jgi:hypothetical protein
MILWPKKKPSDQRPMVILMCDGVDPDNSRHACMERELFQHKTSGETISHWAKRHGWSITYKGQGKFQHLCPICDRLSKVPQSYIDRIAS